MYYAQQKTRYPRLLNCTQSLQLLNQTKARPLFANDYQFINIYMDRINRMVTDRPVVIFSKSSCILSYTIKSLFNDFGVNTTIYELDEMTKGRDIEQALSVHGRTAVPTVYIGGELVGGANEIMSLHLKRDLKPMLIRAGALWV